MVFLFEVECSYRPCLRWGFKKAVVARFFTVEGHFNYFFDLSPPAEFIGFLILVSCKLEFFVIFVSPNKFA